MNKLCYTSNNNLGIMLIITLCCIVARGSSVPSDADWVVWRNDVNRYMRSRNEDQPYSRESMRAAFDRFDQSLSHDHTMTIYWHGVTAIAEVIRQVELKLESDTKEDR